MSLALSELIQTAAVAAVALVSAPKPSAKRSASEAACEEGPAVLACPTRTSAPPADRPMSPSMALHTSLAAVDVWETLNDSGSCAIGGVQSLPTGVYIAMNGRIWHPAKVRENVAANLFEAA